MTAVPRPLAFLASRIRLEERLLLDELDRRSVPVQVIDTRTAVFPLTGSYRGVFSREISHQRNVYAARLLEHAGLRVVNSAAVIGLCGDKLRTTLALENAGLPVPRWFASLTPQAAVDHLPSFGFPAVIKPLTGSWGHLAARVTDANMAEAVLEHRDALPGPAHQITYVQEYIDKPGRDIKAYVMGDEVAGAIYKVSPHWRTNTARGGQAAPCPLDDELVKLLRGAAAAAGPGVLGIDVIEDRDGARYVNEVNHTPEFHGAIEVLGVDLVGRYVDYVLAELSDTRADRDRSSR
jgi:[lysine-biosynthesis-protein LysW]---L-2-aminoadipate ligase